MPLNLIWFGPCSLLQVWVLSNRSLVNLPVNGYDAFHFLPLGHFVDKECSVCQWVSVCFWAWINTLAGVPAYLFPASPYWEGPVRPFLPFFLLLLFLCLNFIILSFFPTWCSAFCSRVWILTSHVRKKKLNKVGTKKLCLKKKKTFGGTFTNRTVFGWETGVLPSFKNYRKRVKVSTRRFGVHHVNDG